jgi:hypothetical protein
MNFAPPIHGGIHMVNDDGNFVIATSIRNPTDEKVTLSTMSTKLLSVAMKERTMTEKGTKHLWSPGTGAGQAVTSWTLDANSTVTSHYAVPNKAMACDKARDWLDEGLLMLDDDEREELRSNDEELEALVEDEATFQYVEPDDMGIVKIRVGLPSGRDYGLSLTRQYDLRTNPARNLDDELPEPTMEAIDSQW